VLVVRLTVVFYSALDHVGTDPMNTSAVPPFQGACLVMRNAELGNHRHEVDIVLFPAWCA
jgi:hypothetical protein